MNEGLTENSITPKSESVPFDQSLELAIKLYKEFEPAVRANLQKEMDGVKEYRDYPNLIRFFLKQVSDDVQARYVGHGITKSHGATKDPAVEQLAALLNILESGEIKGDWGAVKNSGYINAYTSGPFLILSNKDENLVKGQKQSIGAVVVNAEFYPMTEKLKELFPEMNIIKANELPEYMNK